jgi:hypothetical protein
MKPTRESTGDARDGVLGRLAVALRFGRPLATLCTERAQYRPRPEPPTAMYPQLRFATSEGRGAPCR